MSTPISGVTTEPVNRLELERFFAGVGSRIKVADTSATVRVTEVGKFFSVIRHKIEPQQRLLDRKQATHFNVFDFIEPDENRLSDVLAWLLDPNGSHGQGDRLLRLMFKQLGLGTSKSTDAKVHREAPTHGIEKYRRRMDVLVEAGAWLAIENKVDSSEQPEQVKDYLEHLHRCTVNRSIQSTLIYLTPNGRSPESLNLAKLVEIKQCGQLNCWSYGGELREWLEDCRQECESQKIKNFLADFIGYIESKLKRDANDYNKGIDNDS